MNYVFRKRPYIVGGGGTAASAKGEWDSPAS